MKADSYLQLLEWDSAFFGKKIARAAAEKITKDSVSALMAESNANQVDCLYLLLDADEGDKIRLSEESGFQLVDIRVTLTRSIQPETSPWNSSSTMIRLAAEGDIGLLRSIAAANHVDSRFYSDGRFPATLCNELYATWIEKSCKGYADAVLVAARDGSAVGYLTCHLRDDGKSQIGLVGVSSACHGEGLGRLLLTESLRWFAAAGVTQVEVVTQGRNLAAQRLYQKGGFLTSSLQLWYHKWFHPDGKRLDSGVSR